MTFPYVAFPACYGRLPLSRGRVSGVCMEHPISSNNVRCTHFLPLMRRTATSTVSLAARSGGSSFLSRECLSVASVCATARSGWHDVWFAFPRKRHSRLKKEDPPDRAARETVEVADLAG